MRPYSERLLLVLSGAVLSFAGRALGQSDGFRADGYIHGTVNGIQVMDSQFWGIFSTNKSLISISYSNGEVIESGCDGTDSYTLNKMAVLRRTDPQQWEFGYITKGPFPQKNLTAAQLVWIGLGSSHYLDASTNAPNLEVLNKFPRNLISVDVNRFGDRPFLPENIKWFVPPFYMYGTNRIPLEEYEDGWLGAEFVALSTTNSNGFRLPTSFELRSYRPKKREGPKSREDVQLVSLTRCTVTSIQPLGGEIEFLPALSSRVSIQDWRFQDAIVSGSAINYCVSNKFWPKADNPSLKSIVGMYKVPEPIAPLARALAYGLVIAICLFPLLLMMWKKSKHKLATR
jgi:hypothetical protein